MSCAALLRLLTSLPELLVIAILACIGGLVWLIAAVGILVSERVPGFAWRYFRYFVALQGRLFAYHASLTDAYPPLAEPGGLPHGTYSPRAFPR